MKIIKEINRFFTKIWKVYKLRKDNSKIAVKPLEELNRKPLLFNSSQTPKVSIIIPFYNEEIYTWNCLVFLHKHLTNDIPFEILLIDDNSTENNDFSLIKGISIHRNSENLGFLKNINKGIELAKGEYIYILNNDTEVQENFLKELFYVFENFKNVGAVGSKLLNPNKSLQEAGSLFMKNFDIRQIFERKKPFYPEVNYILKVDYCSGCSLLFKKLDDNGKLNLFDEQYVPAYFEETDFCFNLKYIQQKEIYYTPFSEVVHYNGITYNSNASLTPSEKKVALFKTNSDKFKVKWDKQLKEIKAETIEDRIQEIYNYKSIIFFSDKFPEFNKDSDSSRFEKVIKTFLAHNYHVTLICKNVYKDNEYTSYYQKLGVNVFYEYKITNGLQKYLKSQKNKAFIVWFYGSSEFMHFYKIAKKTFPMAKFVFNMNAVQHLKYNKNALKYAELAEYVITSSNFEEEYLKSSKSENIILSISDILSQKINLDEVFK